MGRRNNPRRVGKSILVPIPKKGDLSDCSNYRTISLINHTGKVLLTVLLNRLKSHLDPYLSEEQAGFRKDWSTVHQILTLRLLAEKAKRQAKKIHNRLIDFRKAFDMIKHKIIRCRNKDGHPAAKGLRKNTVSWGVRKQAKRSSVNTPLHCIPWSSDGPGERERLWGQYRWNTHQ